MAVLKGVCWGHRRATAPIAALTTAFVRTRPDVVLDWDVRPLSDFEHQGIAGCASQYDLIVFDHPFCGDIAASGCFVDLAPLLADTPALTDPAAYAGPSLATYQYAGRLWGAPIDAATQHAIYRADLMDGQPLPKSWDEAMAFGTDLRRHGRYLGMALAGPHAILAAAALSANAGRPWQPVDGGGLAIERDVLIDALERITAIAALCPPEAIDWNSIDLHDRMVEQDDIVYCPIVYGYATYGEADLRRRLSFAGMAGTTAPHDAGSAVGGAAIGLSTRCRAREPALAFIRFCLDPERQAGLVGANHGQPATATAWRDVDLDARFNGYFSAVSGAMDRAWVRPRIAGYPAFQKDAGALATAAIAGDLSVAVAADRIVERAAMRPLQTASA